MLTQWINPKYLDENEIAKIKADFLKSNPYPNFALPNFFNQNRLLKVKNEILKEKYEKIEKDLFSLSHTKDLALSGSHSVKEFYQLLSSKEFSSLMKKLTGEKLSLKIDMQSHSMVQGDYLLFHDDVVEGRSIAYIAYLTDLISKDGGALRLYDVKNPLNPIELIHPTYNSFACFKVSSKSLHDVEEIKSNKQRLTIGGWFYGNPSASSRRETFSQKVSSKKEASHSLSPQITLK